MVLTSLRNARASTPTCAYLRALQLISAAFEPYGEF